MPIASSGAISIGNAAGTDRSINVEVGRTQNTANTSMTDVVTAAVTGSTPRGSGSVTDARPHAFSEWHSYTHTQDFGTPTYYVRNTTSTVLATQKAAFCLTNSMSIIDGEASAVSDTVFFMKLNGTVVEFYMQPVHENLYTPQFSPDQLSETVSARDTSGNVASFTGNFSSGFTPMKIAQVETGSVSGRQAKISTSVFSGIGTYISAGALATIDFEESTDWETPHATILYGKAPAAWTLVTGCFSQSSRHPYHRIVCEVKATGYETTTLNTFVSDHYALAISNECV